MNEQGLKLLKSFERLRLKSYHGEADAPGVYTIGWGHVITGHETPDIFKAGQFPKDVSITEEQAKQLLDADIKIAQQGIMLRLNKGVWAALSQDQRAAIVSLTFNIGVKGFGASKVCQLLNGEVPQMAVHGFKNRIRSAGKVRGGLVRRRAAEVALFKGDYQMLEYFRDKSGLSVERKAAAYIGLDTNNES